MHPLLVKLQEEIFSKDKYSDPAEEIDDNDESHQYQGGDVLDVLQPELRGPKEHGGDEQDGDEDDAGRRDAQPREQVGRDLPEGPNYQ